MSKLITRLVINAFALVLAAGVVPGINIKGFWPVLSAAVIMGLVNAFIKPVVLLLTLPINILTLGIFTLFINALMLKLVDFLVPDFDITGFAAAFFGALLISVVSTVLSHLSK
ncbi:MAG: phage holin family protein [Acidobacteria bacterium]|nr:phage holin family protein [Acidobacteriota bacterium]